MTAYNALIHEFDKAKPPVLDDEGDQMIGFYFQFIDVDDQPTCGLIGPYRRKAEAIDAAVRAFNSKDF